MLTAVSWLYVSMLGCWFWAACAGGASAWLRWVLLAAALLVIIAVSLTNRCQVRPTRAVQPLALLVTYGLLLGLTSKVVGLAMAKCVAFGATTFACIAGSSLLVERFGRDHLLLAWRWLWRLFLIVSLAAVATGAWTVASDGLSGPTGNPNMFGGLIASIGAILFLPPPGRTLRGFLFPLEVAGGTTLLIMSRSRSALLGVSVAAALVVVVSRGSRRWLWSAAVLAVGATFLLAVPKSTVERVEGVVRKTPPGSGYEEAPAVLGTRLPAWEESWDAMVAGMPMGFGWGVKEHASKDWIIDFKTLGYGREEGISWLPVGEELGVPGLLLVAWLWFTLFRGASLQPHRVRTLALAVLALMFCVATFEAWFLSPGSWESMAFWTAVGILLARPGPAVSPLRRSAFEAACTSASPAQR